MALAAFRLAVRYPRRDNITAIVSKMKPVFALKKGAASFGQPLIPYTFLYLVGKA
jgi:hypothetical protein